MISFSETIDDNSNSRFIFDDRWWFFRGCKKIVDIMDISRWSSEAFEVFSICYLKYSNRPRYVEPSNLINTEEAGFAYNIGSKIMKWEYYFEYLKK